MDPSSTGPLDPMQMTQQIQSLAASVKELTKQNEELRQRISQGNSNMPPPCQHNRNNDEGEIYSPPINYREESSRQTE